MSHGGLEIGHLVDVEPLGSDGSGERFVANDLKLDRRVAVRLLPPTATDDERTRLVAEARAVGALSGHPNIVTVYDAGVSADGRPYLVTELVDGPDLADRLAVGSLTWGEACDLALQLASGLGEVHRTGRVHGDLRPEHVVLAGSMAKLGDAGLVAPSGIVPSTTAELVHRAPEAVGGPDGRDGIVADERSDLYSLTSILYQAVDGSAAFWRPDDSVEALRARVTSQGAPPLDPDLVPPALAVFVQAGMSADPFDRPQSAAEFGRELELIRQGRTTGSTPSVLHAPSGSVPVVAAAAAPVIEAARWTSEIDLPGSSTPAPTTDGVASTAAGLDAAALPASRALTGAGGEATTMLAPIDAPPAVAPPDPSGAWPPPGPADGPGTTVWSDPRPSGSVTGPVDHTTVAEALPMVGDVEPLDAAPLQARPQRSPLLVGAAALIVVGLLGLAAVLALSLRGSDGTGSIAAPALPDPSAVEATGDEPIEGDQTSPTSLTPLAMMEESTTTTLSDEMVTSTDTSLVRIPVPNVVNLDVEGAGEILTGEGFEVLVVGRVSPGSAPGTVIQQTPAAGTTIELPATVTLFIPRSAVLPFMVGRPAETVCLQLTALGLQCEQTLRFDERVPAGAVIATDPVEGQSFTEGQTIRLTVSRGPLVEAAVPQVAGLPENEARNALGEAGFVAVTTRSEASDAVPTGQAIGTEPAAGTRLTIDQPVVLVLSAGPAPRVTVPELLGLDQAAAEAALAAAQLTATVVTVDLPAGDPGIGRVLEVNPPVGTVAMAGSSVTITVGRQDPASTTTTTTVDSMTTSTMADNSSATTSTTAAG
ncbi:MAG: PASTA domain-containing protein [Actinomycetota bacterium]